MGRHYLDHASTSPPRPLVVDAMLRWLAMAADPGRVHTEGRMVRAAIEDARDQVAALTGARNREVVFTSGATEASNAAVWGAMAATDPDAAVAVAGVEHSCVRDASCRHRTFTLAVDAQGRIDVDGVRAALATGTVRLVQCQWGNHEVGTLQPVADVASICREAGVLVHVDAAMAVGHVPVDFGNLGADLLSLSAHKFGGPAGVGALLVRRGLRIDPFLVGGDQERARRAGMENVPGIVGLGAAAAFLAADRGAMLANEGGAASAHSVTLVEALSAIHEVTLLGDPNPGSRLPHIVCVDVRGVEAEAVLLGLDQAGIAAHSGSACSSEVLEPSPVLEAMGVEAQRSLRLSVGWNTSATDIEAAVTALPVVIDRLRALGRR